MHYTKNLGYDSLTKWLGLQFPLDVFEPGMREVGGNWIKKGNAQLKDIIKKGKI